MWRARINGQWHALPDEATLRSWAARGWVGPATVVHVDGWPLPRYAGQLEGLFEARGDSGLVPFPPLSAADLPPPLPSRRRAPRRLRPHFGVVVVGQPDVAEALRLGARP
jgi:hypothetical protein